jgi:hypothetical protein
MITDADLTDSHIRLMSVDMPLYLPARCIIKLLITSYDVIHSFAIPKFGLKTDAVPGRLNQTFIHVDFLGSVYGQCSELCGIHHAFMPIEIRAVEKELFLKHIIPSYYKKCNKELFTKTLEHDRAAHIIQTLESLSKLTPKLSSFQNMRVTYIVETLNMIANMDTLLYKDTRYIPVDEQIRIQRAILRSIVWNENK